MNVLDADGPDRDRAFVGVDDGRAADDCALGEQVHQLLGLREFAELLGQPFLDGVRGAEDQDPIDLATCQSDDCGSEDHVTLARPGRVVDRGGEERAELLSGAGEGAIR